LESLDVPVGQAMKNRVRELREARGWTQVDFGNLLNVSRQTIYAIETGLYDPSLPLALAIGRVFSCPVEKIFEDDSSNTMKVLPIKARILGRDTKTR
jgi:putative transcriptional regulator